MAETKEQMSGGRELESILTNPNIDREEKRKILTEILKEPRLIGAIEAIAIIKAERFGRPLKYSELEKTAEKIVRLKIPYVAGIIGSNSEEYYRTLAKNLLGNVETSGGIVCVDIEGLQYLTSLAHMESELEEILSSFTQNIRYCLPTKTRKEFTSAYNMSPEEVILSLEKNVQKFVETYKKYITNK